MKLDENFNQQDFIEWIEEFLPDFSIDIRKVDVPKSFTDIRSIITLGESSLNVRVYVIETSADPSKRKVGLATDSFNLLKNYGSPNAIIAYYSKDETLWRISLLTSTPIWSEGKIITKLSNPKRQSYVLGSKAKIKTPYQYLLSKGKIIDFADLKSRFSLEVVNKEFYKEISQAFTRLVGGSVANGKSKKTFEPLLKLPFLQDRSQTNLEFAVRLIGRLIFCWFLREKRSATGHSLVPRELVSFDAANTIQDYYHKILEPIFFEILNKPIQSRKEAFINDLFSAIPYLNGGLFSPHEDDYFNYNEDKQAINHNTVVIPDEWLQSFFEVLETYNFTIDENTSFDEELSIDPEMLGRIFENLLAEINPETGESARKSTGSYYTPRVIVDYMIDESLLLYLKVKAGIKENKLRSLISYDLEDDRSNPLNDDEKDKITQALGTIKILDPACGSGAFPIGALQKIVFILQQIDQNGQLWFKKQIQNTPVELRKVLEREFQEKNFDYIRKLGIIRENIYGIDIQPIATEISRLRCFLTLVVDERIDDSLENRGIEPLPNLDFKFVTANSLIGLPKIKLDQQELFDDNAKIEQHKSLRDQYFTARNEERKDIMIAFSELQSEMINELIDVHSFIGVTKAELTRKLTDWKPFKHKSTDWFDPEWMFGIKDGFDIVIANPPYDVYEGHRKDEIKIIRSDSTFDIAGGGKLNAYKLFLAKSVALQKINGVLCEIFQNSFLGDNSAKSIRKFFLSKNRIVKIDSFPERDNIHKRVFEGVKMSVCILLSMKLPKEDYDFVLNTYSDKDMSAPKSSTLKVSDLLKISINCPIPSVNNNELKLLLQLAKLNKLSSIAHCYQGEINLTVHKKFLSLEKNDNKEVIKGAAIQKWFISNKMSQGDFVYLDEEKYLHTNSGDKSQHHLFERIVMQGITGVNEKTRLKATILGTGYYCAHSVNYILKKEDNTSYKNLLGLLNSKLLNWYFKLFNTNSNVNSYEVSDLPIPEGFNSNLLSTIVDKTLELASSIEARNAEKEGYKIKEYEKQIDQMVYKLYDLTPEEIAIVEGENES